MDRHIGDDEQNSQPRKKQRTDECQQNVTSSGRNRMKEEDFPYRTVYIGPSDSAGRFHQGLNEDISDADIAYHFAQFGTVVKVLQMRWNDSNLKRGYGFVQFQDIGSANKALQVRRHIIKGSHRLSFN